VGATFSAPVQTIPGDHPASYRMGTGSFSEIKWPGRGVDHPTPYRTEVKEKVGLYLYFLFDRSQRDVSRNYNRIVSVKNNLFINYYY